MLRLELLSRFRSSHLSLLYCFFSLVAILGLSSCQPRPPMYARIERVDPSYLASTRVSTPDIYGCCFSGEQVVVHWRLPANCQDELVGRFSVRFRDYSQECVPFAVSKRYGHWIYRLLDTSFCQKGGILSYKAEIYSENGLVAETKHHLYAEAVCLEGE